MFTLGHFQKPQSPQLLRNPLYWFSGSNTRLHVPEEHCCKICALSMEPIQFWRNFFITIRKNISKTRDWRWHMVNLWATIWLWIIYTWKTGRWKWWEMDRWIEVPVRKIKLPHLVRSEERNGGSLIIVVFTHFYCFNFSVFLVCWCVPLPLHKIQMESED